MQYTGWPPEVFCKGVAKAEEDRLVLQVFWKSKCTWSVFYISLSFAIFGRTEQNQFWRADLKSFRLPCLQNILKTSTVTLQTTTLITKSSQPMKRRWWCHSTARLSNMALTVLYTAAFCNGHQRFRAFKKEVKELEKCDDFGDEEKVTSFSHEVNDLSKFRSAAVQQRWSECFAPSASWRALKQRMQKGHLQNMNREWDRGWYYPARLFKAWRYKNDTSIVENSENSTQLGSARWMYRCNKWWMLWEKLSPTSWAEQFELNEKGSHNMWQVWLFGVGYKCRKVQDYKACMMFPMHWHLIDKNWSCSLYVI